MDIIILNSSEQPIYVQIIDQIVEQILKGALKEGASLPSIRSLAKELKVSVITTKRAYEELEREGYIDTISGKGSFVSAHDKEKIKRKQQEVIIGQLKLIIPNWKKYDLTLEELAEIVKKIYEEA